MFRFYAKNKYLIKWFIGLIAITWTLISVQNVEAGVSKKPDIYTSSNVDTSKVDSGIKKGVTLALYFAMGLGALSAAIGLAISSPIVGNTEKGMKAIKGGLIVVAAAGLFYIILGFVGNMFG